MEIVANDVDTFDFFVILNMTEKLDNKTSELIKLKLENWCNKAIEEGYDGYMHFIHNLDFNEERNIVYALIDMGSMNPELGFNKLKEMCDNINKKFSKEIISHIELNGSEEIYKQLEL